MRLARTTRKEKSLLVRFPFAERFFRNVLKNKFSLAKVRGETLWKHTGEKRIRLTDNTLT